MGSDGKGTYSYLKIVEGIEPKEILEAVKVPIRSNAQLLQSSSHHGENSEISRQDLAAAAKLVTARKEEIAMSEKKDTSFRSSIPQREVAAARQTLSPSTLGQSVVATSMRTWTPETSYSNPISPDSGLGRLTESRESEKSAFSSLPSVRGYGPSNGPMGSLPSLKDSLSSMRGSLPSLKESNPSLRTSPTTSKNSSRELHPDLREMAVITNYENHSEHYVFTTNDASGRGLQNGQEINSRKIVQGLTETNRTPMPFRLTRPWPLAFQVKPDSNDAQEIAKALENEERGNHLGTGRQQEALGDPLMHPVTYASNSLKATVRKAGRGSTPNRAAELMKEAMMRKNEETVISTGDPLSTVKGMNYQRLMNEMREQRRIEMQRREAEREAARNRAKEESSAASALSSSNKESLKSESRSSVTPRTRLQIKNRTSTSTRDSTSIATTSNSKKVVKEDENITSFIPQLSIITEDETCDEEKSTFSLKDWDVCPVPIRSSNTLTVPNNNHHLLKMDPLIKMLYQEISEGNDDTSDRDQSRGDPKAVRGGQEGGEGNEGEEKGNGGGEENGEIELTPELIERVRTAIIKRQLSKKGTRPMLGGRSNSKEAESPVEIYGKDSILIAPPDVETLLKAAEFRG